jgi:hypothetical protein
MAQGISRGRGPIKAQLSEAERRQIREALASQSLSVSAAGRVHGGANRAMQQEQDRDTPMSGIELGREAEQRQIQEALASQLGRRSPAGLQSRAVVTPRVTTTETFRVGDLGPNYAGPRYNSVTDQMDSPYNKGMGWFGPLINADKDLMTEYSRSGSIVAGADRVDYPLLVPTLDEAQVRFLIDDAIRPGKDRKPVRIPEAIEIKARDWARKRINQGLSPFAQEGEGNWNQFPDIPRQPRDEIETFPDTRTFSQTP